MDTIRQACPQCQSTLELPASAVGRMARCPACQHTFRVPAQERPAESSGGGPEAGGQFNTGPRQMGSFTVPQSATPGSALPGSAFPPVGGGKAGGTYAGDNPYAFASGSGEEDLVGEALPRGDLMIQRARMDQIFSLGWAIFIARWQPLVLGGLIYIAVSVGLGMLVGMVIGAASMLGDGLDQDVQNLINIALTFVIGIFSWYIWLGLGNVALKVCRNEHASPANVFMPVSIFVKLIPVLIPFFVLTLISQIANFQLQPGQPGQNLQGDPELMFVSIGITF